MVFPCAQRSEWTYGNIWPYWAHTCFLADKYISNSPIRSVWTGRSSLSECCVI